MEYSDSETISGIIKGDWKVLKFVHWRYFPQICDYVRKKGGTIEDAKDVFQETLYAVIKMITKENFTLKSELFSLIYTIAKNQWANVLRDRRETRVNLPDYNSFNEETNDLSEIQDKNEIEELEGRLFYENYDKLSNDCKKVLRLSLEKHSITEMAEILGVTEKYVKKRKYQCKNFLIEGISNNPYYKEITDKKVPLKIVDSEETNKEKL